MRRWWWTALSLVVLAALLTGCCAGLVARRVSRTDATQVAGKVKGVIEKEVGQALTKEAESEPTSEGESEPTAASEEPTVEATVDPGTLGSGSTIHGQCFEGFLLYPGAVENKDAQTMARILAGAIPDPQMHGYATKDGVEKVKAFYEAKPAEAGWEAPPIQGGQTGGGVYYWGKGDNLLIITMVSQDSDTKLTMISMVCGETKSP